MGTQSERSRGPFLSSVSIVQSWSPKSSYQSLHLKGATMEWKWRGSLIAPILFVSLSVPMVCLHWRERWIEMGVPCSTSTLSLLVGPQGLLPSHSIIIRSARGVSGARPSGWVSKSLWLYPFPLLIPESTPCATPIQGEIIPGCNGGLKGKRLCYSSQLLHGPLEHALCLPGCLGLNCDQVVCAAPPPGLG